MYVIQTLDISSYLFISVLAMKSFLIKAYFYILAASIGIFILLVMSTKITDRKSKFTYTMKFVTVYYGVIMGVGLTGLPWFLLRPRNVKNPVISGWFVRKISYILGITWEIRGANILAENRAAIICINHQSSLDIFATLNFWYIAKNMTAISKKEILYVIPFGPAVWLSGIEFINRSNPKTAYRQLDEMSERMKTNKTKLIIFPEGTRNKERGLLPFKKGAFKTAIKGQFPIIPMILSPYHFVDGKRKTFEEGHMIIEVLPPISTTGKTDDDLDNLSKEVRDKMELTYNKLCNEVDTKSKDLKWKNQKRPRMTLINK